jgi:glycosyltransferase involved in cell wall biosynthesis
MPLISAILSVYNSKKYLEKCLDSIISQSLKAWELIIIDDGSNDGSDYILNKYSLKDQRFKLIKNSKNLGLPASLNKAIGFSTTEFIIRVDADDISHPNRFEVLYKFLNKNPEIDVLGSNVNLVDQNGKIIGKSCLHMNKEQFEGIIFTKNPFIHSSVIIRKSFLVTNNFYDVKLKKAQDYDLWLRGIKKNNYYNIADILLDYNFRNTKSLKDDYFGLYVIFKNSFKKNFFFFYFLLFSIFISMCCKKIRI